MDLAKLCNKARCQEIMEEYLGFYNPVTTEAETANGSWDLATAATVAKNVAAATGKWSRVLDEESGFVPCPLLEVPAHPSATSRIEVECCDARNVYRSLPY